MRSFAVRMRLRIGWGESMVRITSSSERVRLMPYQLENNIGPPAHNGKVHSKFVFYSAGSGVYTHLRRNWLGVRVNATRAARLPERVHRSYAAARIGLVARPSLIAAIVRGVLPLLLKSGCWP